jgi:hypothetical protein
MRKPRNVEAIHSIHKILNIHIKSRLQRNGRIYRKLGPKNGATSLMAGHHPQHQAAHASTGIGGP